MKTRGFLEGEGEGGCLCCVLYVVDKVVDLAEVGRGILDGVEVVFTFVHLFGERATAEVEGEGRGGGGGGGGGGRGEGGGGGLMIVRYGHDCLCSRYV